MVDITKEEAHQIAVRVIYELLGRRWIWPAVTTTESIEIAPNQRWVSLEGRPIISVDSVVLSRPGITPTNISYEIENKHRLRFTDPHQIWYLSPGPSRCCGSPMTLEVTYTYGSEPPLEIEKAIEALTEEIMLSYNDPDECSLPDTVTSVTRQGLTMQMLTATDFLSKGITGISTVDRTIALFNPANVRRKARVFSVNKPPPRRKNTTQANIPPLGP